MTETIINYDALIVINMQTLIVGANPYHRDETVASIDKIITVCRNGNTPVIFVRHDDGPGGALEKGTDGRFAKVRAADKIIKNI